MPKFVTSATPAETYVNAQEIFMAFKNTPRDQQDFKMWQAKKRSNVRGGPGKGKGTTTFKPRSEGKEKQKNGPRQVEKQRPNTRTNGKTHVKLRAVCPQNETWAKDRTEKFVEGEAKKIKRKTFSMDTM